MSEVLLKKERTDITDDTLIEVKNLKKYFKVDKNDGKPHYLHAVDDVSFSIKRGEIFGIVGESGSGKSTIGRCLLKLISNDSGEIIFEGQDIAGYGPKEMKVLRKEMQMIFQNPISSFNPALSLRRSFFEQADVYGIRHNDKMTRINELLGSIGLLWDVLERHPKELSGGQMQRLAIARALLASPKFIVADEPVSALDVSVQAQIINLLSELCAVYQMTMIFISHDLDIVHHFCDRAAVVYLGKIVELAPVDELYTNSKHPYTQMLLSANPKKHPLEDKKRASIVGDVPSAVDVGEGCRFYERCPYAIAGKCDKETPQPRDVGDGHMVACHRE